MKIALVERFPLLHSLLTFCPGSPPLLWEAWREGERYDLILADCAVLSHPLPQAPLILVPETCTVEPREEPPVILRGGMDSESAVTLSSIGEDSAWLCLSREILWNRRPLGPFEKKIPFRHTFSLYKIWQWALPSACQINCREKNDE